MTNMTFTRTFFAVFLLLLLGQLGRAQNATGTLVTGTIISETGEPLPGVSVEVLPVGASKDSKPLTTTSDEKGLFRFTSLSDGKSYDFSFTHIGYELTHVNAYKVKAGNSNSLLVRMKLASDSLSEFVVVGYGTRNKRNVTGAVSSIQQEDFNRGVISSPSQLLQGKVPGLNITKSGNPNEKAAIILRGPSTLRTDDGAQEPFYVIDGVPGASIDLVAPADIVSMDVLKDAASTAIYGSRAANGVIMITTRRSAAGQTRMAYNGYVGLEKISRSIDVLSGDELRQYLADNNVSLNPEDDDGSNTDWQKEVSRDGVSHNHNISFGGGTDKTVYGASVNYLDNEGIIRHTSMDRLIVRANLSQKAFNDRLKLDLNLSNSVTNQDDVPSEVYFNMLNFLPTVGVKNADGGYSENFLRGSYLNPVSLIENNIIKAKIKTLLGNARAEVKLFPGLLYTLSLSMQDEQTNRNLYYNHYSGLAQNLDGVAIRSAYATTKKILETYFNYDKRFGEHSIALLAGYSWQEDRRNEGFQTSSQGFVTDALTYNNLALGDLPEGFVPNYGSLGIRTLRLISFYGRANYTYKGKYMLEASVRRDGSSAFGVNNRWGMFPAFSAGWRLSDEPFIRHLSFINDLKFRVGYGVSGNSLGFDPFIATLLYSTTGRFYYDGSFINGIGPSQNENPDLKWERTGMTNIGIDFSLFNGRVGGSLDYYDKRTSDLIWNYNVSTTEYFVNNLTANAGKISNKGIELALDIVPVRNDRFTWKTSVNLAHNKNNVESLSNDKFTLDYIKTAQVGGKGQSGNTSQIVQEGYPIGSFYTWVYEGKDQDGNSLFRKADGTVTSERPSANDDLFHTGSAQPKLIYGWNNNFTYRNFDLNFFFRGVAGNKILNATLANLNNPGEALQYNVTHYIFDEAFTDDNSYLISDRYIENGSYLRLDNATLGYSVPLHTPYISKLRLFATVNNVFTITDYRGIDPEINIGGIEPGIDNHNYYPKTRSFMIGANVIF